MGNTKIKINKNGKTTLATAGKYCDRNIDVEVQIEGIGSTDNKLSQVVDRSIKELTASDLAEATSIGNYAFRDCTSLTSVAIPDSVMSIGEEAFYDCDGLTSVVIGDSVTTIGDGAFYNCSNLTSVVIPDSVTSIGYAAFVNNPKLRRVDITNLAAWCNIAFKSQDSNPLSRAQHLYVNDVWTTEIIIPNSITRIGDYAFMGGYDFTSVTIPDSVISIGVSAFSGCWNLTSINIPDSVTSIGNTSFGNCTSMVTVKIGDGVTSIHKDAFQNCSKLKTIEVSENNQVYCSQDGILYNKTTKEIIHIPNNLSGDVTILDGVTSIASYAFQNRYGLKSITIPESVTTIGSYAFQNCFGLTSITIPPLVNSIGSSAFSGCHNLVEVVNRSTNITVAKGNSSNGYVGYYAFAVYNSGDVFESKLFNDDGCIVYTDGESRILVGYTHVETDLTIPSYVTNINKYAFYNCTSLTSITIPDSVTSIGQSAFYGCIGLTRMNIPNSVTTIDNYAFRDCNGLTLYCEAISKPSGWNSYWNYSNCAIVWDCNNNEVASDRSIYIVVDGIRYASTGDVAKVAKQAGDIQIANIHPSITYDGTDYNVTSIVVAAFVNLKDLKSITIPNGVISIDYNAFTNCTRLLSIVIPESVTSIGSSALNSVRQAIMLSTTPPTIQSNTFSESYLTKIIVPAGCGDAYKAATNWSTYANRIEEATV